MTSSLILIFNYLALELDPTHQDALNKIDTHGKELRIAVDKLYSKVINSFKVQLLLYDAWIMFCWWCSVLLIMINKHKDKVQVEEEKDYWELVFSGQGLGGWEVLWFVMFFTYGMRLFQLLTEKIVKHFGLTEKITDGLHHFVTFVTCYILGLYSCLL